MTQHPTCNRSYFSKTCSDNTAIVHIILDIQKLLDACTAKTGLAFLSACSGTPGAEDYVENSTAIENMKYCLETQLGYETVIVGENVTKSHLTSLLRQVETLSLPKNICRVLFYFFGHGNEEVVEVADGSIKRSDIISSFQSICPSERDVFKIFMFDCCRLRGNTRSFLVASQDPWISRGHYPASTNTLVINAADVNFKAYYTVTNGCGLMTHFFTQLAPTMNDSLRELLVAIRGKISQMV